MVKLPYRGQQNKLELQDVATYKTDSQHCCFHGITTSCKYSSHSRIHFPKTFLIFNTKTGSSQLTNNELLAFMQIYMYTCEPQGEYSHFDFLMHWNLSQGSLHQKLCLHTLITKPYLQQTGCRFIHLVSYCRNFISHLQNCFKLNSRKTGLMESRIRLSRSAERSMKAAEDLIQILQLSEIAV